ncbi:hypothetical protein I3843_07G075900 [Carya illinoinensis]|uniref:Ribosomal protein L18ae family n=1 Tax=Carya illinoinensis TaxID=32201 RepID=A0A922EHE7_CARIL|nr:hypothetical protein I3760_07G077100 [Carya illinoinensis]KAG6703334.1 hypothetical protein I3842_07G078900 [Carya illinoinensis]KAG7970293.1 hypothetical protein I3843_07G075900 [Carya illinoinensis]
MAVVCVGGDQNDHKIKEMAQVQVRGLHTDEGDFSLLGSVQSTGPYDKPLSCFGCGIGWFSFLLGFVFPPLWYYAMVLYLGKYYLKDPRERPGLAASAIAALFCSVIVVISLIAVFC